MLTRDAEILPDQRHGGDPAQTDDELRIDQGNLPIQPGTAGGHLGRLRIAVVRRPALHHVRNINPAPVEVDHLQHRVEKLPRGADKGNALQVFLLSGPLADEHEIGMLVPDAEDKVVPPLTERTGPARSAFGFQNVPAVHIGGPPG